MDAAPARGVLLNLPNMCNELKYSAEEAAERIDAANNAFLEGRMYTQELKTEGRGWNWGCAIITERGRFRFRLLSWFPFVRCTLRREGPFEEVEGVKFPSDAPWEAPCPAEKLWSAYDKRIRRKHHLPVRTDHVR